VRSASEIRQADKAVGREDVSPCAGSWSSVEGLLAGVWRDEDTRRLHAASVIKGDAAWDPAFAGMTGFGRGPKPKSQSGSIKYTINPSAAPSFPGARALPVRIKLGALMEGCQPLKSEGVKPV